MKITLIIPCYNEQVNIQKGVLDKIGNFTKDNSLFEEVIISDDGSNDDTKKIIRQKYLKIFPKFRLVENNHAGKAFAIISGISHAKSDYVMFSDIDLATPIEESEKLIKQINNGYDIAIGSRDTHREGAPLTRKIMALGMIFVRSFIIGLKKIKDTQCGFKIFNRQASLRIIKKLKVFHNNRQASGSSVLAGFDLEFLFLAQKLGFKIAEVPVSWKHVETKNVNFIKDTIETITDILKIKLYDIQGKYK